MYINPFLYQLCWGFLFPFIRFFLYFRLGKRKEDKLRLNERFGRGYKLPRPKGKLIWLHAVSLGESNAAINLVGNLKNLRPDWHFLITTNTITSAENIDKNCSKMPVIHAFQPLDHLTWVSNFLNYWKPDCALFLESDFWFNLITQTKKRQIPIIFASSQISKSSKSKWEKNPLLAKQLFSSPSLILAIDNEQKKRFEQLANIVKCNGGPEFLNFGSLKNSPLMNLPKSPYELALRNYANETKYKIILAASTHENEEVLIANAVSKIASSEKFLLIFAPRHLNRAEEIINRLGSMPRRSKGELPSSKHRYFLSDSMGEMRCLYNVADIIVLGGSFFKSGGHNPIEPALAGKAIICGKSIFKNKSDYSLLIKTGMIHQVKSNQTLRRTLEDILKPNNRMEKALMKGQKIAQEACMRPAKAAHYIISTIEQKP